MHDSSGDMDDADEACTGYGETYSQTTKSDDGFKCLRRSKWFYDSCLLIFVLNVCMRNEVTFSALWRRRFL